MFLCFVNPTPWYSFIRKSVPDDIASSFKKRDDYLSSKQGSLCTFKIILLKITRKYLYNVYINIHLYLLKKLKHNIIFFANSIDRQTDETAFGLIDNSEYYAAPELESRPQYTFLKYPVLCVPKKPVFLTVSLFVCVY